MPTLSEPCSRRTLLVRGIESWIEILQLSSYTGFYRRLSRPWSSARRGGLGEEAIHAVIGIGGSLGETRGVNLCGGTCSFTASKGMLGSGTGTHSNGITQRVCRQVKRKWVEQKLDMGAVINTERHTAPDLHEVGVTPSIGIEWWLKYMRSNTFGGFRWGQRWWKQPSQRCSVWQRQRCECDVLREGDWTDREAWAKLQDLGWTTKCSLLQ